MSFKKSNIITGWAVWLIATIVYFCTLEPTVSWWDCGEYIATAYKLQVGHPPGAPLFQLIGRFFSLFAFGDVTKVALMVNVMSALCSSFTILFLFWTITMLAKKLWLKDGEEAPLANKIGVLAAGVVGALAYTFSETFWFSAVEGEVYAMSSCFTAITFWAMLKWDEHSDEPHNMRWLLFIAFLIGLSIGVHLLNLLCIPCLAYIIYFKRFKPTFKGFILCGLISVAAVGIIFMGLIPSVVNWAGKMELSFVNSLNAPFNLGTIIYFIILVTVVVLAIFFTEKYKKPILNAIALSVMFILIGYSSFFVIAIRANTNTPINENCPKDAPAMLSYLNREQYGETPVVYGPYYVASGTRPVEAEDGNPIYIKDTIKKRYVITDERKGIKYKYDKNLYTLFPRMWSGSKPQHVSTYERYIDKKKTIPVNVKKIDGTPTRVNKPTFGQNLKFFFDYQCNHMYWRYFMWNFAGRQNDIESQGEIQHGNWISGINFLDKIRLGDQTNLPPLMQSSGQTKFYFLPLILGLIGLFFHFKKSSQDTWVVFLLFFMTGLAIIMYLNQTPYQPRERDYAYAGSFYAFAIWIGLGVMQLIEWLSKVFKNKTALAIGVGCVCLVVPGVMGAQGWEEHDRSGKYAARDYGKNYLTTIPKNGVIVTRGDNDTFPLWYVQEVEEYRTDVRVMNYMLSSGYWYVQQLGRKVYDSEKVPFTLSMAQYNNGINEYTYVLERFNDTVDLIEAIKFIKSDNPQTKLPKDYGGGNYMPAKKVRLKVNKENAVKYGCVPESMKDNIVDEIVFTIKTNGLYKNDLMFLDFLATNDWTRPIYFSNIGDVARVISGIDKYTYQEGMVYRFIPVEISNDTYVKGVGGVYTDGSYDFLMNQAQWGNTQYDDVTVDRESARNAMFTRQCYFRVAQALAIEYQDKKACDILDKAFEFFPNNKFPLDMYSMQAQSLYYSINEFDKGDEIARTIATNYYENLEYFGRLPQKFQAYYDEDINEAMGVIQRLGDTAERSGRTALAKELKGLFNQGAQLVWQ